MRVDTYILSFNASFFLISLAASSMVNMNYAYLVHNANWNTKIPRVDTNVRTRIFIDYLDGSWVMNIC